MPRRIAEGKWALILNAGERSITQCLQGRSNNLGAAPGESQQAGCSRRNSCGVPRTKSLSHLSRRSHCFGGLLGTHGENLSTYFKSYTFA